MSKKLRINKDTFFLPVFKIDLTKMLLFFLIFYCNLSKIVFGRNFSKASTVLSRFSVLTTQHSCCNMLRRASWYPTMHCSVVEFRIMGVHNLAEKYYPLFLPGLANLILNFFNSHHIAHLLVCIMISNNELHSGRIYIHRGP